MYPSKGVRFFLLRGLLYIHGVIISSALVSRRLLDLYYLTIIAGD